MVIAHRGYTKGMPENTIAAFDAARALGAGGIVCDVRFTKDFHVVVSHADTYIHDGRSMLISQSLFSDIMSCRVLGSRRLLSLMELFNYITQQAGTQFYINAVDAQPGLLDMVAREITRARAWDRLHIIGLAHILFELPLVRATHTEARIGHIIDTSAAHMSDASMVVIGWDLGRTESRDIFRKSYTLPQLRKLKRTHEQAGNAVVGGVINDQEDMEFFLAADFDNIITDNIPLAINYFK